MSIQQCIRQEMARSERHRKKDSAWPIICVPDQTNYIRRGDITQSHWHHECRPHTMKSGSRVREEFIPTVE